MSIIKTADRLVLFLILVVFCTVLCEMMDT